MNLQQIIENFLRQYGRQFSMNDFTGKCILSSRDGQNVDFLKVEIHRLGTIIDGKYIMFCSNSTPIEVDGVVEIAGLNYAVDGVETYFVGEYPIYKWAVLTKGGTLFE